MPEPADMGVADAAAALARREVSSRELVEACLTRIAEGDGVHSADGDPESVNAWIRVYADDALTAAARADELRARGEVPPLCGVPVGLKDLYAVAGRPLTASSRLLDEVPEEDCDVWARLRSNGMILLGHLHTHEFAAGGTTDQVGNPWSLDRSAGGSSGGSAAALAARMTPAATGTDTAGSLRIPSAFCGTSAIKPTRGLVPMRGIVPLSPSLDHAGPMARSVADCAFVLAAMTSLPPGEAPRPLRRVALSPRIGELDPDVADGLDAALSGLAVLGAAHVSPPAPDFPLDVGGDLLDLLCFEMLAFHHRFDDRRELYRPSTRGFLEHGERRAITDEERADMQRRRVELAQAWVAWLDRYELDALVEPTVPIVPRRRGTGYDEAFTDVTEVSLTHHWDWTGFPVVALPAGVGDRSGLPVGVSLIGRPGSDRRLLAAGEALQVRLGTLLP